MRLKTRDMAAIQMIRQQIIERAVQIDAQGHDCYPQAFGRRSENTFGHPIGGGPLAGTGAIGFYCRSVPLRMPGTSFHPVEIHQRQDRGGQPRTANSMS